MPFFSLKRKSELKKNRSWNSTFYYNYCSEVTFLFTYDRGRTDFGCIMFFPLFGRKTGSCRRPVRFNAAKLSIAASEPFVLC
jgi:hypothetical protein